VEIKLTLALPRDELSVPVVRRILKNSMQTLGVRRDVVSDIELALTEAATNALDHAQNGGEYEVSAGIDGHRCIIEVLDRGNGFDGEALGHLEADVRAEDGRGIQLMRASVDKVTFDSRPSVGTVVHLEKILEWDEGSVIRQLTENHPAIEHGPWHSDDTHEVPAPP
jgi:serine/threonine-protein kinase RsbW